MKVYNKNHQVIYKGSIRGAAKFMQVTRQHIYDLINGDAEGLSKDSPAHYFTVDDKLFEKNRGKKTTYDVGYQFNIKGTPVEITDIVETSCGRVIYTFNGYATVKARKRYDNFNTMYIAAKRALKR